MTARQRQSDQMKSPAKTSKTPKQGLGLASVVRKPSAKKKQEASENNGGQDFAAFFENVSTVLFSVAVEPKGMFRFVSVNQAFVEATGIGREQIVGKLVQEVVPEPSCSLVLKKYCEAVDTKKVTRWEEETMYPTGLRCGEVTVTPICDSQGKVTHLAGVVHDITEAKNTKLVLQESEELYRSIVQTAEEGIWRINADSLTDYVNPKMAQMMGYKPEEMLWRPIDDFLDDEGHAMLANLIERRKGGVSEQFEFKYTRKDGSELWAFVSTNPITNAKGVYVGAVALLTDITVRRQAEAALRESEERYKLLAENTDDIVGLNDTQGNQLYISPSYFRKTGWTPEDLDSKRWRFRIHADDIEKVEQARLQNLAGKITLIEHRTRCKDGSWLWCETSCKPLLGPDGKVWRLLVWSHDITARRKAEAEMQESEERYRLLADNTDDIVGLNDSEGNRLYVSPSFYRKTGWTPEEVQNTDWRTRVHPDDIAHTETARLASAKGTPHSVEYRILCRDGSWLWVSTSYKTLSGADGKPWRLLIWSHDITARKKAEAELRENEQQFRAIFEQVAVGVAMIDSNTGRFLRVNQRASEIARLSQQEMLHETFIDITHPDDLQRDLDQMEKLKKGTISTFAIEKRYLHPDGAITWINLTVSPLWKPGEAPNHHIAVVEDITDRKLSEAKYLRELKFNETLVDHTAAIIMLLDRQGRMEHVNQATVDILGYSRKELLGRTPWGVGMMGPEEKLRAVERFQALLKGGGANPPRETILKAKDGTPHVFALSSVSTSALDGTVDRIIVTGADLTERNRLQREVLKISEQEQARIGHNLHDGVGQTMTGVATLMEALESDLEGEQRTDAARIRQLVQDAIQEVRRMSHSMSPAAVKNRGLEGVLQLLADTIRINHRTACTCKIDPGIRIGDAEKETHIYRIAQEAANNAIRHGKPTKITISLRHLGEKGCVLKIEDNGSGIKKTKARASEGIGLQVMDYRANLIGGTLKITSKPRRGVTVTCRFPCAPSKA